MAGSVPIVVNLDSDSDENEVIHMENFPPSMIDINNPNIEKDKPTMENLKSAGNTFYELKDYYRAIEMYTAAIQLSPDSVSTATLLSNRAACFIRNMNYAEALVDSERAIVLNPTYTKPYLRSLTSLISLGDFTGARRVIEKKSQIESDDPAFVKEMTRFYAIENIFKKGYNSYKNNDFRMAKFYFSELLNMGVVGNNIKAFKAKCLAQLGNYEDAEELANSVLLRDPRDSDALYARSMSIFHRDDIFKSYNELRLILKNDPEHAEAKKFYDVVRAVKSKLEDGKEAHQCGRYSESYQCFSEALETSPPNARTNARLYFNRAMAAIMMQRYQDAVDDCTRCLQLNDDYVKAYSKRAKCYLMLKKYKEAVDDCQIAYRKCRCDEYLKELEHAKIQLVQSKNKNYFQILGVKKDASHKEIKDAYRKLALLHHPDKHVDKSPEEQARHRQIFQEIQMAHEVLTDPHKYEDYKRGMETKADFSYYSFY